MATRRMGRSDMGGRMQQQPEKLFATQAAPGGLELAERGDREANLGGQDVTEQPCHLSELAGQLTEVLGLARRERAHVE